MRNPFRRHTPTDTNPDSPTDRPDTTDTTGGTASPRRRRRVRTALATLALVILVGAGPETGHLTGTIADITHTLLG
ncbi:hypothetical protein [Embleya hyalina]|uniref:Uncharacterized protein n=1 Tax=Embleya hyalina TaxID=516124 RepID=A0A401Z5Q2_9ACTN|nr:hypothetical protein [Embleya hyalina]GCE02175.1 hypothetical protein EHYA_09952 [Embleya hyalina]